MIPSCRRNCGQPTTKNNTSQNRCPQSDITAFLSAIYHDVLDSLLHPTTHIMPALTVGGAFAQILVTNSTTGLTVNSTSCPSSESPVQDAFSIGRSCVVTIFACTWTALHPNISPNQLRSRVLHVIAALLAPEWFILRATMQWFASRELSRKYSGSSFPYFSLSQRFIEMLPL